MTTYTITDVTSVLKVNSNDSAFASDSVLADSLVVNLNAFLIARGSGASAGAYLAPTDAWNVTVNGSIFSKQFHGMILGGGNTAVSTITVGTEGSIHGGLQGLILGSSAIVRNAGEITGGSEAETDGIRILHQGTRTIINTGYIETIRDYGGVSNDTVTNSGRIDGVFLGGGVNKLTNTGTIGGDVTNTGALRFTNSGIINGEIESFSGSLVLSNVGTIGNVWGSPNADSLSNTKIINGLIILYDGADKLTNSGTIKGSVVMDRGNDTVTNTGLITGNVLMGAGNDVYVGDSQVDKVSDDYGGADDYDLGGGNDVYHANASGGPGSTPDGNDIVNGGFGRDEYDASNNSLTSVFINLDTVAHDLSPGFPGVGAVAANTAFGFRVSGSTTGAMKDTIINFENASGGGQADIIFGSSGANVLKGNGGGDSLFGYAGNDRLDGGAGIDGLAGGVGKDILVGGADADTFFFTSTAESTVGEAGRDRIIDFQFGVDKIHLSFIDANTLTAGDQAFNFIGTNTVFTGIAGQLRAYWTANGLMVQGDVNGDKTPDFAFNLIDENHGALFSSDFWL